jgi:sec-independent protein translocase protein TatC
MSPREGLPRMSFGEHLEELRRRLFRSILALLLTTSAAFTQHKALLSIATLPHFRAYAMFDPPPPEWKFIALDYVGPITAMIKVSLLVGLLLASPVIGWQVWRFVGAGLYAHERRWALSFGVCSFLLFLLGCAAGYFCLIPYTLYGLASMLPFDRVQPTFQVEGYLNLVMTLTVALGGVFQLPLVMAFLTRIGLVEPRAWGRWRRHGVVGNLVLAAVLAPGDPLSLAAFALPLVLLYEVGVWTSRLCAPPATPVLAAI